MTTVVYQEEYGKEYRSPTPKEINTSEVSEETLDAIADQVPHGIPHEPTSTSPQYSGVYLYGMNQWADLFINRQLLTLMTFVKWTRAARGEMEKFGYSADWIEAIEAYLGILTNRLSNYASTVCIWATDAEEVKQTFLRFALPITWDFAESNPFYDWNRYYKGAIDSVERFLKKILTDSCSDFPRPYIVNSSAQQELEREVDAIITDPPYYDAISYADLSDFFYIWLRRSIGDQFPDAFANPLTPKSAELVQHLGRFNGNKQAAKKFYEEGMTESFQSAYDSLSDNGRMVTVFAHKDPDAWETLTTAMIGAGTCCYGIMAN